MRLGREIRYCLIITMVILSGCATKWAETRAKNLKSSKQALDIAMICCGNLNEFDFSKQLKSGNNEWPINRTSAAFEFPTGKSFFQAFTMPAYEKDYLLVVKSELGGGHFSPEKHVFHPTLLFLDEHYKPIAVVPDLQFSFYSGFVNGGIEGILLITKEDSHAKYIVVYMQYDLAGQYFSEYTPPRLQAIPAGNTVYFTPTGGRSYSVPYNYEGIINLVIRDKPIKEEDDEDE